METTNSPAEFTRLWNMSVVRYLSIYVKNRLPSCIPRSIQGLLSIPLFIFFFLFFSLHFSCSPFDFSSPFLLPFLSLFPPFFLFLFFLTKLFLLFFTSLDCLSRISSMARSQTCLLCFFFCWSTLGYCHTISHRILSKIFPSPRKEISSLLLSSLCFHIPNYAY